ncbi:MAG: beta-ketoacyl-[acyl-carrier-protein] synthase family protein [Candidatus Omnitrophota bacterium]|jgi:3-oxoacyl-[acyl-carrier-protein] synthase II
MKKRRVVVTGISAVTSIGIGKDEFWRNLISGKSGISKVDAFDTSKHFNHYGGQIRNFKPDDFLDKRKVKLMGRASHFAIAATKLAFKDSKLFIEKFDSEKIAVIIGTTGGEAQEIEKMDAIWVSKGKDAVNGLSVAQYPVSNISSNIAMEFKIKGINRIFTTACAAGNYAIGHGFDLIQLNKADMVIAGGSDAFSYISFTGFSQLSAMAQEKCQPFDKNRKGMLIGEGAAILILETLESALKRKAPIYAEILDYGLSCDATHMTNPNIEGITECMQNALCRTDLLVQEIDYISAHGTGTKNNDKAECAAIKKIFGERRIAVSSIKSMLGHCMGAASAIEAVSCCLVIQNSIIPPTINYETLDPECDIDCVPNKARKQTVNIVLNNAFAFGGNNSCVIFKKCSFSALEATSS